jgi:hypothetical protein
LSCRIFLRIQNHLPPSGEGAKEDRQLFKGSEHHDAQKEERAGKVPALK